MQQAMMSVPVHLIPGHPSFDQHAYQLLLQQQQQQHQEQQHQQHQQQHQHHQQQQQHEQYHAQQQHQQDRVERSNAGSDVKSIPEAQHTVPASSLPVDVAQQQHRIEHHLPGPADDT